jgi:hypothetical protein
MKLLPTLCVAFIAAVVAAAQPVSKEELKRATDHLARTKAEFVKATDGLTEAQWTFKPAPNRWSVAECAEHIAATEDFLMGMVRDRVMKAGPRKEPANLKEIDEFVLAAIPDRTNKAQAPEPLVPTKRFGSPKETMAHFNASRAQTLAFVADTKDLREHAIAAPINKVLDAYQWVLFVSAHCERHTKQILEVKADPGFPRG